HAGLGESVETGPQELVDVAGRAGDGPGTAALGRGLGLVEAEVDLDLEWSFWTQPRRVAVMGAPFGVDFQDPGGRAADSFSPRGVLLLGGLDHCDAAGEGLGVAA